MHCARLQLRDCQGHESLHAVAPAQHATKGKDCKGFNAAALESIQQVYFQYCITTGN